MEEQPWTKVRDEETGQWAWFHPERGERIAISAEDEEDATCETNKTFSIHTCIEH